MKKRIRLENARAATATSQPLDGQEFVLGAAERILASSAHLTHKQRLIISAQGEQTLDFLSENVDLATPHVEILKTTDKFNVDAIPDHTTSDIINLKKVNDINNLNEFLEGLNTKLPIGGTTIGCVETLEGRKKRLLNKFPKGLNYCYYFFDFIFKRVFPKLPITRKLYFFVTAGRNHAISKAEALGRLVYNGFSINETKEINNLLYFSATKESEPLQECEPSHGLILKMCRIGHLGKKITVYKLRTMHPYAQYIQEYLYETNSLQAGGKFNNDYRITSWGRMMRKLWIDEIPMLFNLLKGDLKIVGVRPLSSHYISLYSDELRGERVKVKPGMIPPFYADLPETLDEIMASEDKYLKAYQKKRWRTDFYYGFTAVRNILFKKARSK